MRALVTLLPLLFIASGALAADDLQGRWRPDQDANNVLAQPPASSTSNDARPHPGGGGGMHGRGGGGKGGMGGGGMGGGGRHGGRGRGDDAAASTASPRASGGDPIDERLAPGVADLMLSQHGDELTIGANENDALKLRIGGDAVALPGGKSKAALARSGDDLVLSIDGSDGTKTTHTYRLEGDGKRLRVLTAVSAPGSTRPVESQRLYRRNDLLQP